MKLSYTSSIPKILFTIWIGDETKEPVDLIESWKQKHPNWEHRVYRNKDLYGRKWKNQRLIDVYLKEGRYAGVADVMRYELLYEHGGFCHPADSECLHNIEPLLDKNFDAFGVYENEKVRPGLVSPLYACTPKHRFAGFLVNNLPTIPPRAKRPTGKLISKAPWQVTGNAYMKRMIAEHRDLSLYIWPSYRFNPIHHTGETYTGRGKVYACQQWGTTTNAGIGVKEYKWQSKS